MKPPSRAPLQGTFLASPTNTRLGWKGLPGSNTLAYYENPQITAVKSFIVQALAFFQEQMNTGLREVLLKGRLSTVNLLVPTSLDRLLFILKILFTFFTKQPTSIRRSIVLSLPPQLVFPWRNHSGDTQLYRQEKGRLQF